MMDAVVYRFRAELRTRWRAWVGLAVIVGLIAGAVILLAAGSRRTTSAYDRFLSAQNAYDVGVVVQCRPEGQTGRVDDFVDVSDQSCIDEVAGLPAVAELTAVREYSAYVETSNGISVQPEPTDPCYSGPGQLSVIADSSGRFGTTFNESRIVAGRRADPTAPDEAVIAKDTADRLGLGPGDTLRMRLFRNVDGCGDDPSTWRRPRTLRIVGVGLTPGEVAPPSGFYLATVNLTPAFARGVGDAAPTDPFLLVRLGVDATARDLERQAERAGYSIFPLILAREHAALMRDATRPVGYSLVLIAALVALAGIIVLGQVLIRQAYLESGDRTTLAALGLNPSRQLALAMLRAGFVGAAGAVVAVVAAIAGSPMMPVGVARDVEPAAGISVDPVALGFGFAATLVFVLVVSAIPAWRLAGRGSSVNEDSGRRSRGAIAMARRGIGPVPVSGVRLALDRGSGTRAVPVWSSVAGLVVAATTLIGAITFGAGLTHLLDTPGLVGWNWDVAVSFPEPEETSDSGDTTRRIEQVKVKFASVIEVDEFATVMFFPPFPQGRPLQLGPDRHEASVMSFDPSGAVGPSLISGRAPRAADEVLLGPDTLDTLGLQVGDTVNAAGQAGTWEQPGRETEARLRIVGTGVVPYGGELGQGATMTLDGIARLNPSADPDGLLVRRAAGVDNRDLRFALGREFGIPPDQVELVTQRMVDPGTKLSDLREVDDVPALLGALMALMAAAVLAHVLVSGIGQHRRDLALLRTLGFTRGQVSRAVGWQATTYALITLVVSLPLGIALGRAIWRVYAQSLGVVPEPVTPWAALATIGLAAFMIANLIAALPARRASRAAPAAILRTE